MQPIRKISEVGWVLDHIHRIWNYSTTYAKSALRVFVNSLYNPGTAALCDCCGIVEGGSACKPWLCTAVVRFSGIPPPSTVETPELSSQVSAGFCLPALMRQAVPPRDKRGGSFVMNKTVILNGRLLK